MENKKTTKRSPNIKKNPAWSEDLAKHYGDGAAAVFAVGSNLLLDVLHETVDKLRDLKLDRPAKLSDLPDSKLMALLPDRYRDRYDLNFVVQMTAYTLLLQDSFRRGDTNFTHHIIDEIILRATIFLAQAHLDAAPSDFPKEVVFEDIYDPIWIEHIAGDNNIDALMYDEAPGPELTPEDDYYYLYENLFKDCNQPPEV